MNDIGKTNFLYAIRFVFDKTIRRNGFLESDFYKCKISENIEITAELNLGSEDDDENMKMNNFITIIKVKNMTKLNEIEKK